MSLAEKGRWVALAGLALLGGVYVRALAFTPIERFQGPAQKIFYVHVPAAVTTELAVILVGLAGTFYLFLKDPRLDRFAEASAEVGTVFATIVLTTGPIWGKPIWGTWWTWDARLPPDGDRKSTRLNSSHSQISYAVFCLKKKKKT